MSAVSPDAVEALRVKIREDREEAAALSESDGWSGSTANGRRVDVLNARADGMAAALNVLGLN